jgi:signal transduction histidine kinase
MPLLTFVRARLARLSVRQKLTITYAGLFLAAGAILLALNYTFMSQIFPSPPSGATLIKSSSGQYVPPGSLQANQISQGVFVALSTNIRNQLLGQLLLQSSIALGLMVIISALLGWFVAGRVVQPLKQMTATARRLSERTLHERISLEGPDDELKDLANTFDAMLARLDLAFESQRRFVANASHELRTPLALSRAAVEVVLVKPRPTAEQWRDMAERVLMSTERSERLITSLLLLARIENSSPGHEQADLGRIAEGALSDVAAETRRLGIDVTSEITPAPVAGDPELLRRLVGNLVENAVAHNVSGGWIKVESGRRGGESVLKISNSGALLRSEDLHVIFEPFVRLGKARTGSAKGAGLGLAIVASIAQAHKGRVSAERIEGGGLSVTVQLAG